MWQDGVSDWSLTEGSVQAATIDLGVLEEFHSESLWIEFVFDLIWSLFRSKADMTTVMTRPDF